MNNFDFFVGNWTAVNRRLLRVFDGCTEWDEFPSTSRCWNVFDGAGNFDEITFPTKGYQGATLRLYDEKTEEWSLYWANTRVGLTMPPQVGRFDENGRGEFYADDVYEGRPVRVVYIWTSSPDSPRWEQAFSADGGETWETNWTMQFTRV